jgi:hypothetical protein
MKKISTFKSTKPKHMKKIIVIISTLITFSLKAQVNISPLYLYDRVDPFKPEVLTQFKNSTMAFFYRKVDEDKLDGFKKAAQVWDLTKIEFVPIDKYDEYMQKPNYSYFAPTVFTTTDGNPDIVYGLWLNSGDEKRYKIASIPLELAHESFEAVKNNRTESKSKDDERANFMQLFYTKLIFTNFMPGNVKMYLAQMNTCLKNGDTKKLYEDVAPDENELPKLKEKILYVPRDVIQLSPLFAKSYDSTHNYTSETMASEMKRVFSSYPYTIKLIENNELSDLIMNAKEDAYFLQGYLGSGSTVKGYIGVTNAKTGKIVYGNRRVIAFLKASTFADLIKKINGDFKK